MRVLYCTLSVAHCVCLAFVSAGGPNPQDPAQALKAYYQGRKALEWQAALTKVAGPEGPERDKAAAWLRAILAQALKDEKSGDAPWEPTPFFNEGPRNLARELRKEIAKRILDSGPMPGAVPILAWYFEEEYVPLWQEQAATALGRVKGPAAAKLRAELASKPHPNSAVATKALRQIAEAKESLPAETLATLCQHHHRGIREAARVLNQQLKYAEPPPFNTVQALRSPDVQKLLKDLSALVIDVPPADAPFVLLKTASFAGNLEMPGWLLQEDADNVEIITFWGERQLLPKMSRYFAITAVKITLEDEVALVEKMRAAGRADVKRALELGIPLRTESGGQGALYALLLAERLNALGKSDLTARVLFHALDALDGDANALKAVRQELGKNYGYKMLVAFAGDRDFKATARYADALAKQFPETMFHDYAKALSTQLPKRGDDFIKLTLPTPEEWETLKKKLTRTERIDFLCERMRLLNCFQDGQPGAFYAFDEQYAEPCGMSSYASFGLRKGNTMVINPLTELGPRMWSRRNQKYTRDQHGDLTIKDIPQLTKYLGEDWLIPSVSYFRDFAPGRTLHSTRPIFGELINGLANTNLCQIERWHSFTAAQIDNELERIFAWAKENADKSPAETEWQEVRRILQDGTEHDKWSKLVYQKAGPNDLAPLAAKDVEDKNEEIRIYAALIVAKKGGPVTNLETLGAALEKRGLEWWTQAAVQTLLANGLPEARGEALRLFAFKDLHLQQSNSLAITNRSSVMRQFADAGLMEPYRYYLKQLDNNEVCPNAVGKSEITWAQIHILEIFQSFTDGNPEVKDIQARYRSTFIDARADLKQWLQKRIEEGERKEKAKKK
jgi:hypothetical protein